MKEYFFKNLIFCLVGMAVFLGSTLQAALERAQICGTYVDGNDVVVQAYVPSDYGHAALMSKDSVTGEDAVLASGLLGLEPGMVIFRFPMSNRHHFLQVTLGASTSLPPSPSPVPGQFEFIPGLSPSSLASFPSGTTLSWLNPAFQLTDNDRALHVLNRMAYGPSAEDLQWIQGIGLSAYMENQLNPFDQIDESQNDTLLQHESRLFDTFIPANEEHLIRYGEVWQYFKGTEEPPSNWRALDFDDFDWLMGETSIGYGDQDDATELDDMRQLTDANGIAQPGYLTVYARKRFFISEADTVDRLELRVDYDDAFIAYLNGIEIARANITTRTPRHNASANSNHEAGEPETFDVTSFKGFLKEGVNVLAVQGHNVQLSSSDFTLNPSLIHVTPLPGDPIPRIRDISALQQLVHVRGVYAKRQLQTVLAEFWENHFTTDYDKVAEYLEDLDNTDGRPSMPTSQAEKEAAQMEYLEYQFFYDNALGHFGDLLLYSATSPSQLIYLDNVLNSKDQPNENYAREILELFALGVDNGYNQEDIQELARCFTGWTIRKSWPEDKAPFPESALNPPTAESVQTADDVLLDTGPGWRFFKGTREPSPDQNNDPTTAWTEVPFDDNLWIQGATSIGYGDDDDATVLADMRGNYLSVYLRRSFTIEDPSELENLVLDVRYDDGFVAYLNGVEVGRSRNLLRAGNPPAYTARAVQNHEVTQEPAVISLSSFRSLLRAAPAENILAIQVHNFGRSSSDLSIHPRLIDRRYLPGSIENGDPNGIWTFRFQPEEHDNGEKIIFADTPHEMVIPARRAEQEGLRDAIDVIEAMEDHPSTSEFICIKLINRFVSDEISLESYHNGSAPVELVELLDRAVQAWYSTPRSGHIATVLRTILDVDNPEGLFWSPFANRAKIKTPIEFINSSLRAVQADVSGEMLNELNATLGMELFTRDDPDGWSELGVDWVDTATLLEKIRFLQLLISNSNSNLLWPVDAFLLENQIQEPRQVIDYFETLLFAGKIPQNHRNIMLEYATEQLDGTPIHWDRFNRNQRILATEDLISLILSSPGWQYQ